MKILLYLLLLALVVFVIIQLYSRRSQKNIETYPFTVVQQYEDFEIRQYEPALFTSVQVNNEGYKSASGKGFSILGGYIFGANEQNKKIAMTSPVSMSMQDSMTMMFMVPSTLTKEDLPNPDNSNIEFREVPARKMAAITFGGWANDEKIEQYLQKLLSYLDREGIPHTDNFYFYGYNPPYEVFNRRNEVVIELAE